MSRHPNIDPELAAAVNLVPPVDFTDVEFSRRLTDEYSDTDLPDSVAGRVDIARIELGDGVEADLYRPKRALTSSSTAPLPVLYWMHGGGFVVGRAEHAAPFAAELALELSIAVCAVEYRLAPEHPFPAAHDDCYAGYRALVGMAPELNLDPTGIVVGGQSAGGTLAAGLCLRLRDEDFEPKPIFQYLDIPALDNRLDTASALQFVDSPGWDSTNAQISWNHYLGDQSAASPPKYAVPARSESLAGLPPTYVSVMEVDPLRDEGLEYAARLLKSGVPTELHCFPGAFHGSAAVRSARVTRRARTEIIDVLRGVYSHHQPHRSDALVYDLRRAQESRV